MYYGHVELDLLLMILELELLILLPLLLALFINDLEPLDDRLKATHLVC